MGSWVTMGGGMWDLRPSCSCSSTAQMSRPQPTLGDIPCSPRTAFSFYGPSGLPISKDLLRWWALEVDVYVGAPTA